MKTFFPVIFCLLFCSSCTKDESPTPKTVEYVTVDSTRVTGTSNARVLYLYANKNRVTITPIPRIDFNRYLANLNDSVFVETFAINNTTRVDSFYVRLNRYGFY